MFFYNEDAEINSDRLNVLYDLINNWEDEVVEFKEAENDYDKDKIGKYFSAISNEANLKGVQFGWLIFGVKNKTREIVGSNYRSTKGLAAALFRIHGAVAFRCFYHIIILETCQRQK